MKMAYEQVANFGDLGQRRVTHVAHVVDDEHGGCFVKLISSCCTFKGSPENLLLELTADVQHEITAQFRRMYAESVAAMRVWVLDGRRNAHRATFDRDAA